MKVSVRTTMRLLYPIILLFLSSFTFFFYEPLKFYIIINEIGEHVVLSLCIWEKYPRMPSKRETKDEKQGLLKPNKA